ncbi:A-macroglobulin complement component [Myxococcus sp. CA051A]|uniref:MG2 domain-containing protein n=1 Tax=Myxococcus sp. CA051A TaxID=2741739 RepID=UPI00157B46D9|nr:alpha-2-macroglobulin family protein [Myxococcus sp. CA051A]NTX60600.1 A-macroglobulin complement component [Myxococcus sp. CA051A]
MTLPVPRLLGVLRALGLAASVLLVPGLVLAARPNAPSPEGRDRPLTFVSTDKPFYRPGESVLVRGLVLQALTHKPMTGGVNAVIEVRGPRGDLIAQGRVSSPETAWGYSWSIPAGQAGGEYTLRVSDPWTSGAPVERKFEVRAYRAPRLKTQVQFLRDGYGPGDTVTATLDVTRAEGGVPETAKVSATALVDGASVAEQTCAVDPQGRCTVRFNLPKAMERGEGTLAFTIQDGGVVETAAKTIPILLQTLDLAMYPEGGELVAGLTSRVYFEARTPASKPADLTGVVLDTKTGRIVATVRSEHEGRGRFELTPRADTSYALRIDSPAGIKKTFPLPTVKATGAVIRAREDVIAPGGLVRLVVSNTGVGRTSVTLSQREVRVASAVLDAEDENPVTLDPGKADGVLIATVWDADGRPLAERLVFRQPAKEITVELKADRTRYEPGAPVELTARTLRGGEPVSALVMLTVTDDAVLQLQEKREQAPSLPVMVLLEHEVKELADAQLYFDKTNPKSRLAVDLLLGTQGWRRFAFIHPRTFMSSHGDAALRTLAMHASLRLPGLRDKADRNQRLPKVSRRFMRAEAAPEDVEMAEGAGDGLAFRDEDRALKGAVAAPAAAVAPPPPAPPAAEPVLARAPEMQAPADLKVAMEVLEAPIQDEQPRKKRAHAGRGMAAPVWQEPGVPSSFIYLREYAHVTRPGRKSGDRVDFAETLYWNAGVRTDARTGEVRVRFATNDSVTTFKATAGAVGDGGELGSAVAELESSQPFYVEPKLPLEVTSGDVVRLPVALVNGTDAALTGVSLKAELKGDVKLSGNRTMDLAANGRGRQLLSLEIGQQSQPVDLKLIASTGNYTDTVTRTLSIKPRGFPGSVSFGGLMSSKKPATHTITLPDSVLPGSVRATIALYPGPVSNLTESLARLIREPSGCFEQTSSTTYPMTMAQQYFQTHTGVNPELVASAREKLTSGYQRLVGFETKEQGYEWFGEAPGHEALTAFGLLHFTDLQQVHNVDTQMLLRTREWMLKQRDGQGGFNRKRRALHVWVEDPDTSNAYITWALLESAPQKAATAKELTREVAAVKQAATKSTNSYVVALAANVLSLAGDSASARSLMGRLAKLQQQNGVVGGGTQSIVGSSGDTLEIETTALSVLAWLREPEYLANVQRAMKYMAESSDGGRYGATQSTVLALRAIIAYDKAHAANVSPGRVRVFVEGRPVGEPVSFTGASQEALKLPDVSKLLGPGGRQLELRMEDGSELPYTVEVTFNALVPDSSKQTQVSLEVALAKHELIEGEPTEARLMVLNRTGQHLPTAVAIFGVPGGLEVRHDQLKELVKRKVVDAYEVLGRDVVLYWRGMEAKKRIDVPLSLVASVPGTYTGPASRAYLYYTDEHKVWTEGVKVTIAPKS